MPAIVWCNGSVVEWSDARVSAFDAGLQHGVGLFETMLAIDGEVYRLDAHVERLCASARDLGLSHSLRHDPLCESVRRVARQSELPRARVRLTVTGGDLNMLARGQESSQDPTVIIAAQPATEYPDEMFERGVRVVVGDMRLNPLDPMEGHKTLNYWSRLRALQEAARSGGAEALMLQVTNHVCSGAVSNVFVVRDGVLHTPIARGEEEGGSMASPVLPGITRGAVFDLASRDGIGCSARMLSMEDVLEGEEVFMTNSSWGVLPVVSVEAASIGDGVPGPMTRRIREMLLDDMAHTSAGGVSPDG
ncbi:MAG: aminotransferase class IV [Phycisphaerales bacterium JB043]